MPMRICIPLRLLERFMEHKVIFVFIKACCALEIIYNPFQPSQVYSLHLQNSFVYLCTLYFGKFRWGNIRYFLQYTIHFNPKVRTTLFYSTSWNKNTAKSPPSGPTVFHRVPLRPVGKKSEGKKNSGRRRRKNSGDENGDRRGSEKIKAKRNK